MENFKIFPIDRKQNEEMLSIMKASPINANGLFLYLDKSPDVFSISNMKYIDSQHLGFFQNGKIKGFASIGYFDGNYGGNSERIFTLYNFYILPEARGNRLPEKAMKLFFDEAKTKAKFGYTIILKGNRQAESFIGRRGYSWMPPSRIIDDLVVNTILFAFPRKNRTDYMVRNAEMKDISEMVQLRNEEQEKRDFGIILTENQFLNQLKKYKLEIDNYYVACNKKGKITGTCLAWDCSSFRRTHVIRYSSRFYPALITYKALDKIFPIAPFPKKNECFNEITVTDYATKNRDVKIMHSLLTEIYRRNLNRNYHFLNFGSCKSDNLLQAAKGFWCQQIVSSIVFSSFDPARFYQPVRLPYIDIAFL